MLYVAIAVYAVAMTLANLSVAVFGPAISPVNSFFLIGLDLSLRDVLHVRLRSWQMGALIACTGLLTYALNPSAGMIAIASSCAFSAAALADWVTFSSLKGTWLFRSNGSNAVGAAVDSIVFPTLAFGALMPHIVALQFAAKVGGGAMWSLAIKEYATTISSLIVKPVCDKTILGESTTVRIDDIGSGMFVRVEQDQGRIVIDPDSWPHIMEAVRDAVEPWLRAHVSDQRFWDGEYDTEHVGEYDLPVPTEKDRDDMLERYSRSIRSVISERMREKIPGLSEAMERISLKIKTRSVG